MRYFISVIFFLIAIKENVLTRKLRNAIDDNAILYAESHFPKQFSLSNRGGRLHKWGPVDYDVGDEDENEHRVVFPNIESRETPLRTSQRDIRQCITSCRPSSEYQLICGTDGVTYQNLEQLQCFMSCGVDVQIRQLSPCPGWGGTTPSPIPTTTFSNQHACMSSCPTTSEYNPVCGSDGVTYYNHGKLVCAQWCGRDVQEIRRSPCPKIAPTTAEPATITSTTPRSTIINSAVRTCITSCPSTSEYKPVCGTDRQTYFNLSRLQCAIYCGVDVSLHKSVPCHVAENISSSNNNNKENDDGDYDIDIRIQDA